MTLAAAKSRFKQLADVILLSDQSLEITNRYVGTISINTCNDPTIDDTKYMAPNYGIILVEKNKTVVNKWIADTTITLSLALSSRPSSIVPWLTSIKQKATITNSPKREKVQPSSSSSSSSSSTDTVEKQILVVDDSSVSSRMTAKKLEGAGFTCAIAYNGEIAYDMVSSEPWKWKVPSSSSSSLLLLSLL
jgi:hypothetical protein